MFAKAMTGLVLTAATCQGGSDVPSGYSSEVEIEFGIEPYEELEARYGDATFWADREDTGVWTTWWSFKDVTYGSDLYLWLTYDENQAEFYGFDGFETDGAVDFDMEDYPGVFNVAFTLSGATGDSFDDDDFWTSDSVGRVIVSGCPSSRAFHLELADVELEETTGSVDGADYSGRLFTFADVDASLNDELSWAEDLAPFAEKFCR